MTKTIIAFDLDGTLAPSKMPLPDEMGYLLTQLLGRYEVCIISGGMITQFHKQLLSNLEASPTELQRLHLMPTCGTQYYLYDIATRNWDIQYAENFTNAEKQKIITALNKGVDELGYREKRVFGNVIEDRESQITFSALGQDIVSELGEEGLRLKEAWDPDDMKKMALRDYVAPLLPEFEVRVGGISSVDITKPGIDKAYGMQKLLTILDASKDQVLFIGDRLEQGGNDYPVKAMGVDTIAVTRWQDTALIIETLNKIV